MLLQQQKETRGRERTMEAKPEEKAEFEEAEIEYVSYGGEHHLPLIMNLVDQELSEPYSIFTYRYFVYLWPQLSFLQAFHKGKCIGTVVCKMGEHRNTFRGYIAMLVVIKPYRGRGIATELVTRSIRMMMESGCEEYVYILHRVLTELILKGR
ncbi:N-alpha-acetyltransferase MAK3 isoform X3 [Gossypium hirsutum]|uniref:N-alpha-acetyltransferase MAK3 isoform X3 n=1 Tax=Gossypium hirsutum TaxID=3635 RepID=A0A1U8MAX8_GOSHI|nr:N-alpha-acetyltransferase MAK3 isoform X3 [Gossypium hirsutum]